MLKVKKRVKKVYFNCWRDEDFSTRVKLFLLLQRRVFRQKQRISQSYMWNREKIYKSYTLETPNPAGSDLQTQKMGWGGGNSCKLSPLKTTIKVFLRRSDGIFAFTLYVLSIFPQCLSLTLFLIVFPRLPFFSLLHFLLSVISLSYFRFQAPFSGAFYCFSFSAHSSLVSSDI